jgi:hypothetical protein
MTKRGTTLPAGVSREDSSADEGLDLFPADWPARGWHSFQQSLLATVYERSESLWPALRAVCDDVTRTIEHQEYEDEILPEHAFHQAVPVIWHWHNAVPTLRQARALLGTECWQTLIERSRRQC